jgi:hypothetical protein
MLDRPHLPRIEGCTLRDGSYYWLVVQCNVECRFGEPVSPEAVRIAVFAINGALIEEARIPTISCSSKRCGTRHRPAPPGRGWALADETHASFTVFRRTPPWLKRR